MRVESMFPAIDYNKCCWFVFKAHHCNYTGYDQQCDKTFESCKRKGQEKNFPGFKSLLSEEMKKEEDK